MGDSKDEGMGIERQLELQAALDSIYGEMRERRSERNRTRFVSIATLVVALPLFWFTDFPGRPDVLVMVVVGLVALYVAASFAYAEISTLGYLTSAAQRLEEVSSRQQLSPRE